MNTACNRVLATVSLAIVALPAAAHHSPAAFDLTRELIVEGTVTTSSWRNPHIYFSVETVGPDGKPLVQQIEAGPAAVSSAMGFDANTIRPGDHVVVRVRPNRAGPGRVVLGWQLTTSNGTVVPLHARAMTATVAGNAEATSIAGTWVPQGTGFAGLAVASRDWPLTEKGRAVVATTRAARVAARSTCVPYGPPALMALPAVAIVEIGRDTVTFTIDAMNARRVVHLDQPSHPAGLEPTLLGHSIGRWDGGTLVVETAGFTEQPEGFAFDLPSSTAKRVVERFTLNADRKHLDYEAVVEDPEYFAAPITHRSQWDYRPGLTPANLPCDREAAARFATDE